jgi:hypothetical protein
MLDKFREWVAKNPWAGWMVVLALLGIGAGIYFSRGSGGDIYSPEAMTQTYTIRYTDTNETEKIPRGRLEKILRERGDYDPTKGIINPKTGQPTGFLVDDEEWTSMLSRLKAEREAYQKARSEGNSPLGERPATPPK